MRLIQRFEVLTARSIHSASLAKIAVRQAIRLSIDWAHDHMDYLVGIAIGLVAIGYLAFLLNNKPVMTLDKKPAGLQGKELQDYLSK